MSTQRYGDLMDQWCAATGMQPWPIDEIHHVEVDGVTVALVHDAQADPDTLHLYIDLGVFDSPDVVTHTLRQNMIVDPFGGGYFAQNPENGTMIYRQGLPLHRVNDGAELTQIIHQLTQVARRRMHEPHHAASSASRGAEFHQGHHGV